MKIKGIQKSLSLAFGLFLVALTSNAQDPNLHIYLCFGQSNMEGQGAIQHQDKIVNERFTTLQALDCSNLDRTKDLWYTAIPPTCQCYSKLSPADYFGHTMVANTPDSITIGIINVAIGGCDIRIFDKDIYQDYDSTYVEDWFLDKVKAYNYNPYEYLINLAQLAQTNGVIKGILLHQGETNTGDAMWPSYVKKIYNDMLSDLSLNTDSVPLLAGEVVHEDQDGMCASMNNIIANLPDSVDNAYVISSSGCTHQGDNLHFSSTGYRELGRRYAVQMLDIKGYELVKGKANVSLNFEAECGLVGANWRISEDDKASNEAYIHPGNEIENASEIPTSDSNFVSIDLSLDTAGFYDAYGRIKFKSDEKNSLWVKFDDAEFVLYEGPRASSWAWIKLISAELEAGDHTLTIAIAENGTQLDKINLSNYLYGPDKVGDEASNLCTPELSTSIESANMNSIVNKLGACYPNPTTGKAQIDFELSESAYISLKIYSVLGKELMVLSKKNFASGAHTVKFDVSSLPDGIYFYTLKAGDHISSKKMMLQKN